MHSRTMHNANALVLYLNKWHMSFDLNKKQLLFKYTATPCDSTNIFVIIYYSMNAIAKFETQIFISPRDSLDFKLSLLDFQLFSLCDHIKNEFSTKTDDKID